MAPPKTMAIGQQQQQQFSAGQQSPVNKSQTARLVKSRKAKQQQSNHNTNNNNNNSTSFAPILEKTQQQAAARLVSDHNEPSMVQHEQINNNNNKNNHNKNNNCNGGDNLSPPKQQVAVPNNKQIPQPLNTSTKTTSNADGHVNGTTNDAKSPSTIKVINNNSNNTKSATNSPAPSERTTLKQRKEAAAMVAQTSPNKQNQKQTNDLSDKTTQGDLVSREKVNPINTQLQQQQQHHQQAQTTPSSQLENNNANKDNIDNEAVVLAAAAIAKETATTALITSNKHNQINSLSMDDDIDAGIELDGSSNSGSSVKDANEDQQMKSNSVSPVMQPSVGEPQSPVAIAHKTTTTCNPITVPTTVSSESISDSVKKPQASIELKRRTNSSQLASEEQQNQQQQLEESNDVATKSATKFEGELSTSHVATNSNVDSAASGATMKDASVAIGDSTSSTTSTTTTTTTTKKTPTMTRDELAKERQVIDQDEQLIQERLENKQRKFSGASTCSVSDNKQDFATSQDSNNSVTLKKATTNSVTKPATTCNDNQLGQQHSSTTTVRELVNLPKNDISSSKSNSITGATPRIKRHFSTNGDASSTSINGAGLKSLCKNCNLHVYQMERMLAEKSLYHKQCFKCFQCKMQLRIDNYASHEGQVYCKLHHKQIFQPQVKLNSDSDAESVAKSTTKQVDDYLLQRGRLSELTFSFLNNTLEGSRQKQMIICENEPVELASDVVRSDSKVDDGINNIKLNLSNILQKFENGSASNLNGTSEDNETSPSATVVIEKPRFNIKQKLAAFENNQVMNNHDSDSSSDEQQAATSVTDYKPIVGKLGNVASFLNKFNQQDEQDGKNLVRKVSVKRSESLMGRLKKFESRIAGEHVDDDDDQSSDSDNDSNNNNKTRDKTTLKDHAIASKPVPKKINLNQFEQRHLATESEYSSASKQNNNVPKLGSIDLSSLKNRWENGDIKNVSHYDDDNDDSANQDGNQINNYNNNGDNNTTTTNSNRLARDDKQPQNINSPVAEKREELFLIRQQLAQRRGSSNSGKSSVKNIYEQALREAEELQKEQLASTRRDSSDFNALQKLSTSEIQQQLLQQKQQQQHHQQQQQINNNHINNDNNNIYCNNIISSSSQQQQNNSTPTKDHFQLNISRRANKLKEKFELGLINNNSRDSDDDELDGADSNELTKLEQIRQEKLEDLSVFTDGEIKAREARHMFQQIDRRLSSTSSGSPVTTQPNKRFINSKTKSISNTATTTTTSNPTSVGS